MEKVPKGVVVQGVGEAELASENEDAMVPVALLPAQAVRALLPLGVAVGVGSPLVAHAVPVQAPVDTRVVPAPATVGGVAEVVEVAQGVTPLDERRKRGTV